jgi:nitrite reductase/ring-hydroxylating ferredoxin subunit
VLIRRDIQVLNRVGPATVLGNLLRQYWLPILTSAEVKPRARPVRVRLLGETLVAYRDDQGAIGLVGEACSHAGASLTFAINEGDGVRCVLHDWKFDATGHCVDLPGLVPGSGLLVQARIKAYRTAEIGDLVFAYLGPRQDDPPPLPPLPWEDAPLAAIHHRRFLLDQSWSRSLAGALHPDHATESHPSGSPASFRLPLQLERSPGPDGERRQIWLLPTDDDHTQVWQFNWNPVGPLSEQFDMPAWGPPDADPYAFPEDSESSLLAAFQTIVEAARALREEGTVPTGASTSDPIGNELG